MGNTGFFSFSGSNSKLAINEPKFIRKLISVAVAAKRNEGDLVPSIITKKCCELYENLDKVCIFYSRFFYIT